MLLIGGDGETLIGDDLKGQSVSARVTAHVKGKKLVIGKHRRRTGFRRRNGFRASLSRIEIESIGEKKPARGSTRKKAPAPAKAAGTKAPAKAAGTKAPAKAAAARRRRTSGAQEGPRLVQERPRLGRPAPRRQGVLRPGRERGRDHRPPARDAFPLARAPPSAATTRSSPRVPGSRLRASGKSRFVSVV